MQVRPNPLSARSRAWLWPVLVCGLVLACYWPALHGALLWDDPAHVTSPDLRSWDGLCRIWFEFGATQQYYPVLCSAFWVEHRLWGDSTFGYHLCNAVLHALNCCLLAAVLRRLWTLPEGADGGVASVRIGQVAGWGAALLFAAHPVCVESVAWITEQKNTLSLCFVLLAALAYLRFETGRSGRAYAVATVLFLAALGSKTTAAMLPPLLLVLLWWRRGALSWRRDVLPLAPWFAFALGAGLLTSWVERTFVGAEGESFGLSLLERALLAARIVWFFLAKLVWPMDRAFFYRRWDVPAESAGWAVHLGAAVLVTVGLWVLRRKTRGPFAAWLVLGGALFPALGFFNVYPFLFSYVADHFHYLAAAGMAGAFASGAAWLLERTARGPRLGAGVLAVAVVVTLAAGSHRQSALYVGNEPLFRDNIARVPDNWMAHRILAHSIAKTPGREAEAIALYRETLRLKPDLPEGHLGLAVELAKNAETVAEAIAHYQRAIALRPGYIEALNNLGALLLPIPGREPEAVGYLEQALRLKSDFVEARLNLGDAYLRVPGREVEAAAQFEAVLRQQPDDPEAERRFAVALAAIPGRSSEAFPHFERALRLAPDSAPVHFSYGNALAKTPGRMAEAAARFAEAVRLAPGNAEAHANLGKALLVLRRPASEALGHLETALRLNPRLVRARSNAAMVLASAPGREGEAVALLEEGLRLEPRSVELHNTLAILHAQGGRFAEARTHWEAALALNPRFEDARQNLRRLEEMGR